MRLRASALQHILLGSVAIGGLVLTATPAAARDSLVNYNIPAQPLGRALKDFGLQNGMTVMADTAVVRGKMTQGVKNRADPETALRILLRGTGLTYRRDGSIFVVTPVGNAAQPRASAAEPAGADSEIVVTAQKREEKIIDVPIAMTALSGDALDDRKIEGGSELLRAVPNVSFSKSNFASYNFSIRGIGTKALAVSTDPAVAISFNNAPLIRNRLFEQEYFDVARVEVLRGPQGTLYGRNATGGVVNMIPNIARPGDAAADLKLETGNYKAMRASGMVNVPLGDTLAVRAAGAWTSRDGYDVNTYTGNRVNGRDLWSTRVSAAWEPSDNFRVNAIWEHFYENDNRSRTGKQLCHRDPGPSRIGNADISALPGTRGALSQGCLPKSIYDDGAFGVPNGLSMPHVIGAGPVVLGYTTNVTATRQRVTLIDGGVDPYEGVSQSRNLREINTQLDPVFRAKNDVYQFNIDIGIVDNIKLSSQSLYTTDNYYSTQDYYRFVSNDVWNDSSGLFNSLRRPNAWQEGMTPGGVFDDPQLGASSKLLGMDMVRAKSKQYYQEIRLQSDLGGSVNFNIGANYTKFKIDEDYFVFNNLFTALSHTIFSTSGIGNNLVDCEVAVVNFQNCAYVDYNPIEKIDGDGHNYFRSRNVSKTESYGIYGEVYYNLTENLKLTAGLRYTHDKKTATPYKSQLLLAPGTLGGGLIGKGLVADPDIIQRWGRMTGRLVVDWKPYVDFADDLLVYGSYARGYKGGGANPPPIGFDPTRLQVFDHPATFGPEGLNAFEIGLKGAFADRKLTVSASAFYYDYGGYQVSQIVDRLALNENFDAEMWGADIELAYRPSRRFKMDANVGFLKSKIGKGQESIDVMNRTQGDPNYAVVKPWLQLASNCIVPVAVLEKIVSSTRPDTASDLNKLCGGNYLGDFKPGSLMAMVYGVSFDPAVDAPNGGRGIMAQLGGNELPNAPRWTLSLGAQYMIPVGEWETTLRADYYVQGKSWARVYNSEIDRLKSWSNINLSLYVERPDSGLRFQLYVKNILNMDSITDIFLNSDDSSLTANVFTVDPRLIGFQISKSF
ncbi:MAG: TonB-dependent receptor [Sphingopyxis granuli]